MQQNFDKDHEAAIKFLMQVRSAIKGSDLYVIADPDPLFAQFYRAGNGKEAYYVQLTESALTKVSESDDE